MIQCKLAKTAVYCTQTLQLFTLFVKVAANGITGGPANHSLQTTVNIHW